MSPRVAVLGCGYWGSNHVRTLKSLGALAAVADINADHAEEIAEKYGVEAIAVDSLFERRDVDALVLALPPQFHTENVIKALKKGKDVLVEKPIALNVIDAQKQVAIAKQQRCIFMVGHVLRFHPAFEKMLELVHEGVLGEVKYIHAHRLGFGKFHTESDALWDLAPHDLSMILALTGCEPEQVHSQGAAIIDNLSDFAHLHMVFPNGVRGHLFASRLNPYRERRLSVVGTKAMAVFDDIEPWARKLAIYRSSVWRDSGGWAFTSQEPDYIPVEEALPLTRELQHFLHCVKTRASPCTDGEEAIAVLKILNLGRVKHNTLFGD